MAELALAIVPLGIIVTSSLVKYLKAFGDHDKDRARLTRQAERFESTFQSLETVLKRSQLTPELSVSSSEASVCLRECQTALRELETLQQKLFSTTISASSTTAHARTKDKIKDGCKKLIYPLRRPDIEALQEALNKLSTPLTLALGMLHLDQESLTRKILNHQTAEIQRNTVINSNTSTVIEGLRHPISQIGSSLPVLQTSVDAIVPHFDQRFDQISYLMSYQQAQIKSLLDMAGQARNQHHLEPNQQPSSNHSGEQGDYLAPREIEQELRAPSSRADSVSMCSCQRRPVRQNKWRAMGPFQFAEEMLFNFYHEKDCDFFTLPSDYKQTRAIRFTGSASLLKKGIEVSFSTGVSAGRSSISRSFTYFPLVDESVAPAFLVMSLLEDACDLESIDEKRCRILLSTVQQKLQELFCSGRASPNDVTPKNQTLLYTLAISVFYSSKTLEGANSPFMRLTCEGLVRFLIATGTSVTVRDINGYSAFQKVIAGTFVPPSIYSQLNTGSDVEDYPHSILGYSVHSREVLDYYEHNQSVARIFYGPLSLAVIQDNLSEVERVLSLNPHMIEEKSSYGETPLHIAIYRPDILEALAKKASPDLWILSSNDCTTVLNLAPRVSREICDSETGWGESCCPCTLPLRIILAAECPIIPYRDFGACCHSLFHEAGFFEASLHCKTLLTKELRSRRLRLLDLAQNKLSITEISNFTPLEEVPDNDAIEIDRLLRQKGLLSLGPLSTFLDENLRWRGDGYYYSPIFFHLASPEDAKLFIESDFKMACTDQVHNSSLERVVVDRGLIRGYVLQLEYALWLFEYRAPLWKWSYRFTSPMPSIFVLADILGLQECKYPSQDNANGRVEHYLSKSVLMDKCSCLCSPDGCTPFTSRMKWLAHHPKQAEDLAFQDYATRFGSHVAVYGRSLNLSHHAIMVRQATFSALKLRHTCLDRPGCSRWPDESYWMFFIDPVTELEPDEKEFEILNVDVEARNQLDEIVAMFQDFVLTGHQTTISNKSDTFDLDYSAFDEPAALGIDDLYYHRVSEFWEHIWVNRMQVALDTVAKGWENKLHGQDDLVQISTCEEAGEETEDSEESDDDVTFNRVIQEIQDI